MILDHFLYLLHPQVMYMENRIDVVGFFGASESMKEVGAEFMHGTDRDTVICGSGSPSLLVSPHVGSGLFLFSLIIA